MTSPRADARWRTVFLYSVSVPIDGVEFTLRLNIGVASRDGGCLIIADGSPLRPIAADRPKRQNP
jgi:hypothetical protein